MEGVQHRFLHLEACSTCLIGRCTRKLIVPQEARILVDVAYHHQRQIHKYVNQFSNGEDVAGVDLRHEQKQR